MTLGTFHIKMEDYDLSIGPFCVKLRSRIWFRRQLGQASDDQDTPEQDPTHPTSIQTQKNAIHPTYVG